MTSDAEIIEAMARAMLDPRNPLPRPEATG